MSVTLADVQTAAARIAGSVRRTNTVYATALSAELGTRLWLKEEHRQVTASFKERGALNRLLQLDAAERGRGVIAMSAGNHAQALAYHGRRLGIGVTIVMPTTTAARKIVQTERYGARVILEGDDVQASSHRAHALAASDGLIFVSPYDDAAVIAGQGTVALEMLADAPQIDTLLVPIGGGGLAAGIGVVARALRPNIRLVGVQSEAYPALYGRFHHLPVHTDPPTIAEGIAVAGIGEISAPLVTALYDDIVLVPDTAIERAMMALLESEQTVVEGAGAAGLAAIFERTLSYQERSVGLVLSGGNIDPSLLATVIQHALARAGRVTGLRVELSDSPGALARVAQIVGDAGANIIETHHQRFLSTVAARAAELDLVVETRDEAQLAGVMAALAAAGYRARRSGPAD